MQGMDGEMRSVARGGRQSACGGDQVLNIDVHCMCNYLPLDKLGYQRATSHGGDTTLSKEAGLRDAIVIDSQSELQNVSAGRVFDLGGGLGVIDLSGVARVLEVIEKLGRVHAAIVGEDHHEGHEGRPEQNLRNAEDPEKRAEWVRTGRGKPKKACSF